MARAILTAKPGDTAAVIKSKLDYIASRSKRSAADAAFQDRYGQLYSDQEVLNNTTDRLNSTVQQSAQALADAQAPKPSARDVQSRSAIQRLIGNAPEITGDPVKDLPAVQKAAQQVDDFVNGEKQAGRWTEQDQNSLQRINDSAKTQEDLAEAYKSAAACLVAKGAIENV
jgi:uncharacterized protein YukE